jgi:CRP-like cAMP-binding protein
MIMPDAPHGLVRPEHEMAAPLRRLLGGHMNTRHFSRGQLLWREGETTGLLVALRTGRVKIYRVLPTGRSVTVFICRPGDVIGFLPFLDGEPYPANAQAMDAVEAEVMPRSVFHQVLAAEPTLALEMIALLGRRLREAMDTIQSVSTPGARGRLASALLALLPETRSPGDRLRLDLPVSAHEYADVLGMAAETLSRAISDLAAQGLIRRVRPGRLEVLDLPGLERAARSA